MPTFCSSFEIKTGFSWFKFSCWLLLTVSPIPICDLKTKQSKTKEQQKTHPFTCHMLQLTKTTVNKWKYGRIVVVSFHLFLWLLIIFGLGPKTRCKYFINQVNLFFIIIFYWINDKMHLSGCRVYPNIFLWLC